jgi:hypothetical protein
MTEIRRVVAREDGAFDAARLFTFEEATFAAAGCCRDAGLACHDDAVSSARAAGLLSNSEHTLRSRVGNSCASNKCRALRTRLVCDHPRHLVNDGGVILVREAATNLRFDRTPNTTRPQRGHWETMTRTSPAATDAPMP